MPYLTKEQLDNDDSFLGTWSVVNDLLNYTTPTDMQGTIAISVASRYDANTPIIDMDGNTVGSFSGSVSVSSEDVVVITPTIAGASAPGTDVYYDPTETLSAVVPAGTLVPGTDALGSWTALAQPATVGSPSGKLVSNDYMPITSFIEPPAAATTSSTHKVSVIADHANGIDRVEFYANGGAATTVTAEAVRTDWGVTIDPRVPQGAIYTTELDLSGVASGVPVEVRAIVYPTYGTPRVLQGRPIEIALANGKSITPEVQEGTLSIFVTKVNSQEVISVTGLRGLSAAITAAEAEGMSDATKQYVFELQGSSNNWNDGASLSVDTAPYVPVVIRGGEQDRGTYTFDLNCPLSSTADVSSPTSLALNNNSSSVDGAGSYIQYENLHIDQSTSKFDSNSDSKPQGHIIKDCLLDRGVELLTAYRGVTLDDPLDMDSPNADGIKLISDPFETSGVFVTKYVRDQPNFSNATGVFNGPNASWTAGTRAGCGVFILESTVANCSNLGGGTVLQRNNVHLASTQDICNSATALNIYADDTNFRGQLIFILSGHTTEFWDPTKVYAPDDVVLVQDENPAATVPAPRWGIYVLNGAGTYTPPGGTAAFDSDYPENSGMGTLFWNRTDPHVDMYQPPVATAAEAVQNVIYQEAYMGPMSVMQPWLHAWKDTGLMDVNGVSLKNWTCFGEQNYASSLRSQYSGKMTNFVIRNGDWTPPGSRQFMGMNLFRWASGTNDNPTDFCIIDSTLGAFGALNAPYTAANGTSLSAWGTTSPGVEVSNSTGTYGFVSPSGTLVLEGNANVGSTLTYAGTISDATTETFTWYRSNDGSTGWAVGFPPDLAQEAQIGPIAAAVVPLGSFEWTWTDDTVPNSAMTITEATDNNSRVGIWAGPPRGGSIDQVTGNIKVGPGYSSADNGDAAKGLYGTDTHPFTGNDPDKTKDWREAQVNGNDALITIYRTPFDGSPVEVSTNIDISQIGTQGGYLAIQPSKTIWSNFSNDFAVGDVIKVEGFHA